ncbi:hypothetical protein BD414DRAFT_486679 [Trametes punicea]|nr:hypothetical protein BD414DRAFT_486679 [Trametes punicea]
MTAHSAVAAIMLCPTSAASSPKHFPKLTVDLTRLASFRGSPRISPRQCSKPSWNTPRLPYTILLRQITAAAVHAPQCTRAIQNVFPD